MIVVLDNYDSFTYNLVHYIEKTTGEPPVVMRNDQVDHDLIESCSHLVLSPGPGLPREAGDLMEVIARYVTKKKILGVCLGHQALAEHFGASLLNPFEVHHGVASEIAVDSTHELFHHLPPKIAVGRYHSWCVNRQDLPPNLTVTSEDETGVIMSFKHKTLPIYGVQFHPESILTPEGLSIIKNFIELS